MDKCPVCGYVDVALTAKNKPVTSAMSSYVDEKTGKMDGIYNSEEKKVTVGDGSQQRILIRADLYVKPPSEPIKQK